MPVVRLRVQTSHCGGANHGAGVRQRGRDLGPGLRVQGLAQDDSICKTRQGLACVFLALLRNTMAKLDVDMSYDAIPTHLLVRNTEVSKVAIRTNSEVPLDC